MNLRKPLLAVILLALALGPASAQNNTGAGGGGLMSTAPINMFKSAGAHQQLTVTMNRLDLTSGRPFWTQPDTVKIALPMATQAANR